MDLRERLRALCDGLPPGSSVTLPTDWLREALEADDRVKDRGDRLLTLEDVAEATGRAVSTVRTWCNSGALGGAFRLNGRDWRVRERDLQRYLDRQANPPEPESNPGGEVDLGAWRKERKGKEQAA